VGLEGACIVEERKGLNLPSGLTWSRLAHSKSSFPVAISSSVIAISYWKRLYRWIANSTLNNGIDDPLLVLTSTPCSQIAWNRLIYLDQASLLVDNVELVLVNQLILPARSSLMVS
jgi:hypothetical protein